MSSRPLLIVITGPTGSGKSALALDVAEALGCEIVSADSRQIYRGLEIGTAAPAAADLRRVRHHFVGTLDLHEYYSAARYEEDVMAALPGIFARGSGLGVMCGGSMMYVDAVVRGIDELPTVSGAVRSEVLAMHGRLGTQAMLERLRELDPVYAAEVDPANHRRIIHAIEICMEAGRPVSELRTGAVKKRPFDVMTFAIGHPREVLFERINRRVEAMVEAGLVEEARGVYPLRHLNALNTVGYKELFAAFDGLWDLPTALARMAKNTRVYAKKQLTWLARRPDIVTLIPASPDCLAAMVVEAVRKHLSQQNASQQNASQ